MRVLISLAATPFLVRLSRASARAEFASIPSFILSGHNRSDFQEMNDHS